MRQDAEDLQSWVMLRRPIDVCTFYRETWGFQGCRVKKGKVWINRVGTYGVGSIGFSWSRLDGSLHRLGFYAVGDRWAYEALLFADGWMAMAGAKAEI